MTIHIESVLLLAIQQAGDTYVMNSVVNFNDPDPEVFDCSGLVQWSCHRAGVTPNLPRASWQQAQFCGKNGTFMEVLDAVETRGALLFSFFDERNPPAPVDVISVTSRPKLAHVAISLGNGWTMEAANSTKGVNQFDSAKRKKWTHAARIPGVDYGPTPVPEPTTKDDDDMIKVLYFAGPDNKAYPYVVSGCIGKFLSPEALAVHTLFQTEVAFTPEHPAPASWAGGVALLDGPLQNVNTRLEPIP